MRGKKRKANACADCDYKDSRGNCGNYLHVRVPDPASGANQYARCCHTIRHSILGVGVACPGYRNSRDGVG